MSLLADSIETARRLALVVGEETRQLLARGDIAGLKSLASEKAALADRMEQLVDAMKRAGRAALLAEPASMRADLRAAMAALDGTLAENARVLGRRKSLSEDLLGAVLAEAKRQAGTRLSVYGRSAPRTERAAAIACSTRV